MAVHKNYVEWYWRDWNKLCSEELLPYQNEIFKLFSDKFHIDAEKDWERWRKLLQSRWNKCWEICNEIHLILWWNDIINEKLKVFVNNVVNLDYGSLCEVFVALENQYYKMWLNEVSGCIDEICLYLKKMRHISKSHTIIDESFATIENKWI